MLDSYVFFEAEWAIQHNRPRPLITKITFHWYVFWKLSWGVDGYSFSANSQTKKYTPESLILPFTLGKLTRLFLLKKVKPLSSLQIWLCSFSSLKAILSFPSNMQVQFLLYEAFLCYFHRSPPHHHHRFRHHNLRHCIISIGV